MMNISNYELKKYFSVTRDGSIDNDYVLHTKKNLLSDRITSLSTLPPRWSFYFPVFG